MELNKSRETFQKFWLDEPGCLTIMSAAIRYAAGDAVERNVVKRDGLRESHS